MRMICFSESNGIGLCWCALDNLTVLSGTFCYLFIFEGVHSSLVFVPINLQEQGMHEKRCQAILINFTDIFFYRVVILNFYLMILCQCTKGTL